MPVNASEGSGRQPVTVLNPASSGADAPTPDVLREAAQWLSVLHSGRADQADQDAFTAWRQAHASHEQAWQRAQRLSLKLGAVPASVGMPVLARSRRPQGPGRRSVLRSLALLGTAAPAAWMAAELAPWHSWSADHRTATGERREVLLPDGSRVLLDTASAMDVRFDAQQRLVILRAGAILVTTAADRAGQTRPFIVQTHHTQQAQQTRLRALGTRFGVRELQQGGAVRLAVEQGAVEVTPQGAATPALVVPAGQQTVLSSGGIPGGLTPLAPEALAWSQGVLLADGMRLKELCAELSRYRVGILHCADAVADLRISGAFQLADTDYALAMLATAFPVRVVMRTRYWVSVLPA